VSRDIRLRLAFRREEPGRNGCEDDDYEADEDAPAKGENAVSKVWFLRRTKRIMVFSTRLPLWLTRNGSMGELCLLVDRW
jgi:hypothetical protein